MEEKTKIGGLPKVIWSKITDYLDLDGHLDLLLVSKTMKAVVEKHIPSWERISDICPVEAAFIDKFHIVSDRQKVIIFFRTLNKSIETDVLRSFVFHLIAGNNLAVNSLLESKAVVKRILTATFHFPAKLDFVKSESEDRQRIIRQTNCIVKGDGRLFEFATGLETQPPMMNALMLATLVNNKACVAFFLEQGMQPGRAILDDRGDDNGEFATFVNYEVRFHSPLHFACSLGKNEIVNLFVDQICRDVDKTVDLSTFVDHVNTLLIATAYSPEGKELFPKMFKLFFGEKVTPELLSALKKGLPELAEYASVDMFKHVDNFYRKHSNEHILNIALEEYACSATQNTQHGDAIITYLEETQGLDFSRVCMGCREILDITCMANNLPVARRIMSIDFDNIHGSSLVLGLNFACTHPDGADLVKLLLENDALAHGDKRFHDSDDECFWGEVKSTCDALKTAATNNTVKPIKILLANDYLDKVKMSLEEAQEVVFTYAQHPEIFELFYQDEADLHSLFYVSFKAKNSAGMKFLVSKGYDLNKENSYEYREDGILALPALMLYIQENKSCRLQVVRDLVRMGADINDQISIAKSTETNTNVLCSSLYFAVYHKRADLIIELAKLGAKLPLESKDQQLHGVEIVSRSTANDALFDALTRCYPEECQEVFEKHLGWCNMQNTLSEDLYDMLGKVLDQYSADSTLNEIDTRGMVITQCHRKRTLKMLQSFVDETQKGDGVFFTPRQVACIDFLKCVDEVIEKTPRYKYAVDYYRSNHHTSQSDNDDDNPMSHELLIEFMNHEFEDKPVENIYMGLDMMLANDLDSDMSSEENSLEAFFEFLRNNESHAQAFNAW